MPASQAVFEVRHNVTRHAQLAKSHGTYCTFVPVRFQRTPEKDSGVDYQCANGHQNSSEFV